MTAHEVSLLHPITPWPRGYHKAMYYFILPGSLRPLLKCTSRFQSPRNIGKCCFSLTLSTSQFKPSGGFKVLAAIASSSAPSECILPAINFPPANGEVLSLAVLACVEVCKSSLARSPLSCPGYSSITPDVRH